MGNVAIDSIEVGMILAGDVRDRSGRMLLGAGAELTSKHLVIFRTWGVLEADIEGHGDDAADTVPIDIEPSQMAAAERAVAPLFRNTNREHPAIRELMRLAALRKVPHVTV